MATKKTVNKTENKVDTTKAKASVKQAAKDVKEVAEVVVEKAVEEAKVAAEKVAKEAKVAAEKVAKEAKETAKETVQKAKKAATKKEIKTTLFVQYFGKEVAEKDMIASVKKAWTNAGNKVGDIKTITLYVNPEESAVYYVINGTETGKVEF